MSKSGNHIEYISEFEIEKINNKRISAFSHLQIAFFSLIPFVT